MAWEYATEIVTLVEEPPRRVLANEHSIAAAVPIRPDTARLEEWGREGWEVVTFIAKPADRDLGRAIGWMLLRKQTD